MKLHNLPPSERLARSRVPAAFNPPALDTRASTRSLDATSDEICPCCGSAVTRHWLQAPDWSSEGSDHFDLVRCSSCQHTWISHPPTASQLSRYYGPDYHTSVGRTGETTSWRWERELRLITRYKTGGSLLDIGCSSGGFLSYLKQFPWKLYGIEPDQETAARARSISGGAITATGVDDAEFAPESFDVITCSDVLEHLPDPRAVFERVARWLKPSGIFYVFVPNIGSWESRLFGSHWYGLDIPRHLHHYSPGSLKSLADFAGLDPVRIVTPPGCYLEQSLSTWLNAVLRKAGAGHSRINLSGPAWFGWRAVRKGIRLTLEAAYAGTASLCGAGPSLQAVFQKPEESRRSTLGNASEGSQVVQAPAPREGEVVTQ